MTNTYETILVERDERVGIITLNRPKALNALNSQVMDEVTTAAAEFDDDPGIGAIIITGSEKAFAAGADIKEMADLTFAEVFDADFFATWAKLAAVRTPTIAAVAGYALGGGCELAMMCDLLIAADTAKFGQPEIKLGVLPGMGGSQRLTRAIGKAKAMDLILTGRTIGRRRSRTQRPGFAGGARRRSADRGQGRRHHHLADVALGGPDGQGGRQPRLRVHAGRGAALRTPAVPFDFRDRRPVRGHGGVHREANAELHPPLSQFCDWPTTNQRVAASPKPPTQAARAATGSQRLVGPALHLHRHHGRPDLHLVLDDAVAAAARSVVPGSGQRLWPAPSATASASSPSGWCATCAPRTPAHRHRAGRGWR